MSLVTEALRKARQDAATKEAARQGRVVSLRAARPPQGPFDVRKAVAIAALVLGAGLGGGGLVWWGGGRSQPA
ncbi:MAG TPA: hypothetical protein PKL08_07030, partial [Thermoanaerobaculaceae bacterium]|nr:hypothetical protein [Thermoanaerobaculaceae bacterium]